MTDVPDPTADDRRAAPGTPEPPGSMADGELRPVPDVTIVVGVARDDATGGALSFAVDLAERLAAGLAVVHVVDLGDYPGDIDAADWEQQAQATLAAERAEVEQALAGHAVGWTYQTRRGDPVAALVAAADEHDAFMVVVGRHGHTIGEQLRRLLEGSVAHRLLNRCGRPVLVVPTEH